LIINVLYQIENKRKTIKIMLIMTRKPLF